MVDALTGIGNRRALDLRLQSEVEAARRYKRPLTFLMIDIDRFKTVNDNHGHLIGDEALKCTAERISGALRGGDFAARFGGEEFAVIAQETNGQAAQQLSERVRRVVQDTAIPTQAGQLRVTVSVGVVSLESMDQEIEPAALIAAADEQLYLAKRAGRNRCCHSLYH